ncbi:MAG: hypothetical protein HYW78_01235 [Parcubacteria group bacterium]|nr:hypothetical protein [Parcubacteria group bacterium]
MTPEQLIATIIFFTTLIAIMGARSPEETEIEIRIERLEKIVKKINKKLGIN